MIMFKLILFIPTSTDIFFQIKTIYFFSWLKDTNS